MNYYERHLGDYAKDAGHLSLLEHGAYTLLLDRYYSTEAPIPEGDVFRVCRASSKPERAAVAAVLREFFELRDGAWHSKRADQELERYRELEPEREAKRANERERQRRTRERRREAFEELRQAGIVPAFDASMSELNTMLERVRSREGHAPVTRDDTATQSPDTRLQNKNSSPGPIASTTTTSTREGPALRALEPAQAAPVAYLTPAGQACRLMREAGCLGVNPSHPHLLAALAEGVTPEQLADLARELPGKGFPYLVQTARARRAEASDPPPTGTPRARKPTLLERLDAITTEPSL